MIINREKLRHSAQSADEVLSRLDKPEDLGLEVVLRGKSKPMLGELQAVCEYWSNASPTTVLALFAQIDRLEAQVKTLQSDANSWQSGYDEGRRIGTKTALDERSQLKALLDDLTPDFDEVARICRALAWLGVAVPAGGEEQAARWRDLVRQVVLAAEQSKMLRQDAGDIQALRRRAEFWRSPADMPEQGRPVIVLRDAISVGNSLHPGARCGRWLELTSSMGTMFTCDAVSKGNVIGWADVDEFLDLGKASHGMNHSRMVKRDLSEMNSSEKGAVYADVAKEISHE